MQTADTDSLRDLVWLQGTTPLVQAIPLSSGRPLAYDAETTVRMLISQSATNALWAVRTNSATITNCYAIQWPTVGTNSAGEAWFYTLLFDKGGQTYWSGNGRLYITATTGTGSNGIDWVEYTIPNVDWSNIVGDPAASTSLVAYVSAHAGGTVTNADYIQWNTSYSNGTAEGRMQWNADDGTLEVGMPGGDVNLQIGQEHLVRVRNTSGATISNGMVVAATGQQGDSRPLVELADADAATEKLRYPLGIATEDIEHNDNGFVTIAGLVRGLNTSQYPQGMPLYLSTNAGQLTATMPSATVDAVVVAESVISNATTGVLLVNIHPSKKWAEMDSRFLSTNEQVYIENAMSAGRMWGGNITVTGTTINVAAGGGVCKEDGVSSLSDIPTSPNDGFGAQLTYKTFEQTQLTAIEGYNIVFYDCSANVITNILKEDFFSLFDVSQDFTVGRVYYEPSFGLVSRLCGMNNWSAQRRNQIYHDLKNPVEIVSGGVPSATGLKIAVTASRLVAEGYDHFTALAKGTNDNYTYWYKIEGVWTNLATHTISNSIYNLTTGDADGFATLAANRWKAEYAYLVHDGSVHVVMGEAVHLNQSAAIAAAIPTPPGLLSGYGALIARITIQSGAATMTLDPFATAQFSAAVVQSHNDLSNLQGGAADEYYHLRATDYASVTGKVWEAGVGDASAWSSYPATQSVNFAAHSITNISGAEFRLAPGTAKGTISMGTGSSIFSFPNLTFTNGFVTFGDGIILGGETRTNWPESGTADIGTGPGQVYDGSWGAYVSNRADLAYSVGTNALAVAQAGGGGGGTATVGAEGKPYEYAWSTNIVMVAGTNAWNQQISGVDGGFPQALTLTPPTNAALANDVTIWLRLPPTMGNTFTMTTAGVAEVRGGVPTLSTNDWTQLVFYKRAGTNFFTVNRKYR